MTTTIRINTERPVGTNSVRLDSVPYNELEVDPPIRISEKRGIRCNQCKVDTDRCDIESIRASQETNTIDVPIESAIRATGDAIAREELCR